MFGVNGSEREEMQLLICFEFVFFLSHCLICADNHLSTGRRPLHHPSSVRSSFFVILCSFDLPPPDGSTKDMVDASGQPLIRLPQVSFYQHKVQLKPAVRELYDEVEREVAATVKASTDDGNKLGVTHLRASRSLLSSLLRRC
jgi:hypothetical protein